MTGINIGTALLSLTPGGMPEMVAMAEEMDADMAAVSVLQFIRMSSVVILASLLVQWVFD
jgi:uncharacterized membrane protein AbrB (regulator of aidB expression)